MLLINFLSTSRIDGRNSPEPVIAIIIIGGDDRNRTGVQGFADLCVATPPRRRVERKTGFEPAASTLARWRSAS